MKQYSLRFAALFLSLILLFSFSSCALMPGKTELVSVKKNAKTILPESTDLSAHYYNSSQSIELGTSGFITLARDPISSSLGVLVSGSDGKKLWTALPQPMYDDISSDEANLFNLEVVHDGNIYKLNSQDNSVSYGFVTWQAVKSDEQDNITAEYLVTDNKSCVEDIGLEASDEEYLSKVTDDILFKITVTYTVIDGSLYARMNWKNLGCSKDILSKIGFLEYFGASSKASKGDFLLVPDGCGAIIDTHSSAETDPVSVSVYGDDLQADTKLSAVAPVYALKQGKHAFAAIIEEADALAAVGAAKALYGSNYNRVGPVFTITPSYTQGNRTYYSDLPYSGEIKICYRFVSGSDANYADLAAVCREQFIRNFTLSTKTLSAQQDLPVSVTLIGASGSDNAFTSGRKLTSFDEATDILSRIKSKGINNVYLRCAGFLDGGLNAQNGSKARPMTRLGGMRGLKKLSEYAGRQQFNVFIDVDLITGKNGKNDASDFSGKKARITVDSGFATAGSGSGKMTKTVKRWDSVENTVLKVLERYKGIDSAGFCVTDMGRGVYTDCFSRTGRQVISQSVNDMISPLSVQNLVMVGGGNFYALKSADVVTGLPMTTGRTPDEGYIPIPFMQIILHGIADYGSDYLNISDNSIDSFLKCLEYGAIPSFILTSSNDENGKKYSADSNLPFMLECYNSSTKAAADLRGSGITDHFKVAEGVYCTEYESTTKIYVNYTDEDVSVSGIKVEAHNWFRVN